ncbi:MAG: deoxyribodipyrimidine photo-lyase [Chitinophagales bacterium]|nr:deoxyribodipyrimidine photo-lyase [Chitinophagales bacterium]MBP8754432.1 deoxyribodipyrimidine photo-lyase [Chitinophagales bacterium]MBP9190027.1 deoxyribodipyrimidine photo-lyase [Chitinophagales bacterium]MBP9703177.1 deoxyribodipyrimidine photo-lyase [Chitinophagales bacterium]
MQKNQPVVIHWFRRDLRLQDNTALFYALQSDFPVLPLFIFDKNILSDLSDKSDARVNFIYNTLLEINDTLKENNASLLIQYGNPFDVWKILVTQFEIKAVYTNKDYEPYGIKRDKLIADFLQSQNISFYTFKDQVLFEEHEVVKEDGKPYSIFTPYANKYRSKITSDKLSQFPSEKFKANFLNTQAFEIPSLESLGFTKSTISIPSSIIDINVIEHYHNTRNFPALSGTTRLSVHLRFGTCSIRQLAKIAIQYNAVFMNELIWRDFYQMILFHFPHVVSHAFKPAYDNIQWRNNKSEFNAWCNGETGYPMVDAGMRELNTTGFMHNRVRMVTASFLTKHLLIDWRWGEAYFAAKLLDYDLASNNGGWQWAAGSGCDAAPYFRIFNPAEQLKKFDMDQEYIRKWIPEIDTAQYPNPIVNHKEARERVLKVYKQALQ